MKTRAQDWSRVAYQRVSQQKAAPASGGVVAKYKTSCNKMPSLIHQSGVLQALVFQCARDADGRSYVDHLAEAYFQRKNAGHRELIERAQKASLTEYVALTRDISSIAQWFRRFAQIELQDIDEDQDD